MSCVLASCHRSGRSIHLAVLAGCAAGMALAPLPRASAQTLNWTNANGGSAAVATNWTPNGIPTATSNLIFNIASALSTIPITIPAAAAASAAMTFRQESCTLTMSSPHTTAALTIGDLAGDNAAVVVATGTLTATGTTNVGDASGSTGSLSINDDDASFVFNAPGLFCTIGNGGTGTLLVLGGGLANIAGQFAVAPTGTGTVNVSGQLNSAPFTRSRLLVSDTQASIGATGDATLNVTNGGLAQFSGDMAIASTAGGKSTATVQGLGLLADATLDVGGNLRIGMNTGALGAGAGTMYVHSDGVLDVAGTIFVGGDAQSGTGTLHSAGTGAVTTTSLTVGAGGTLDLDGGTVDVDGGTLTWTNPATHMAIGGAGGPVLTLRNNAQCTLNVVTSQRVLTVSGAGGIGDPTDFDVRSGSDLNVAGDGTIVLGAGAGDDGGLLISGVGSSFAMPTTTSISVGQSGAGRYVVELGAAAALSRVNIALNAGSTGLLRVQSPGTIASTGSISVGGSIGNPGGTGTFIVDQDAVVNITSPDSSGVKAWPGGFVEVSRGAILNSNKQLNFAGGDIDLEDGGTLNSPSLFLGAGSILEVNPDFAGAPCIINAATLAQNTAAINLFGDLTIGNAASPDGFETSASVGIDLHGHTLTILDASSSHLGHVDLTSSVGEPGGTLIASSGLQVSTGIAGHGTVKADALFSTVSAITMDAPGIVFDGVLTALPGAAISGPLSSVLQFLPSGGFVGQGAIAARVNAHIKSTVTATGNLTLGAASPTGVVIDGTLKCGGHIVTLLDSNGVTLGSKTELIGGTLQQNISLGFAPGDTFQGMGLVETGLFSVNGKLKPGDTDAAGPETDTITCTGDIQIGAQTHYLCHIGPPGLGEEFPVSDRIQTTQAGDSVQINGGTLEVQLLPFYTPQSSDKFDVVKGFAGVAGTFDAHVLPPGARVSYLPNAVRVHFCYPDCDGDGTLSIDDFICFQTEYAIGVPSADCEPDGILDINDFICFQTYYAIGC